MSGYADSNKTNKYDEAQIAEIINYNIIQTTLDVGTSTVEAKVGSSKLEGRKVIILQSESNNVKFGFTSGSEIFPIFKNQLIILPIGDNISLFLKSTSGTISVNIAEGV